VSHAPACIFAIPFPDIGPEVFSISLFGTDFALRWYALAYIAGIVIGWRIVVAAVKRPRPLAPRPGADDARTGRGVPDLGRARHHRGRAARLHAVLPAGLLPREPVEILYVWQGGMSFHGGFLGVVAAGLWFCRRNGISGAPDGGRARHRGAGGIMLGRLANFVNAELWGRPTSLPWGVIFPGERAQDCPGVVEGALRPPSLAALRGGARGAASRRFSCSGSPSRAAG
jgi:phosphatidylglycerol---prolipoprotein diacylglyceryl transferase